MAWNMLNTYFFCVFLLLLRDLRLPWCFSLLIDIFLLAAFNIVSLLCILDILITCHGDCFFLIWNTSWICMSSWHRVHANLCIIPIFSIWAVKACHGDFFFLSDLVYLGFSILLVPTFPLQILEILCFNLIE